jgi:RNA polymerase sigma-70 factor (ECF subfamily)
MLNWDNIVALHGPLVWRTVYRFVGNESDAADCYQEAFAAALSVSRRENVRNWPALLHRLATVHALDRVRRRSKSAVREGLATDLDRIASAMPAPSQRAQDQELVEWLRAALVELPQSQAEVFALVCVDEMSYQEAAEHMNIEQNHVKVLLHRARARLRELLTRRKQSGIA